MLFKSAEVVEFAIAIERNGEAFYKALLDKVISEQARPVLQYLAKAEGQHIEDFQNLRDRLGDYQTPQQYDGEYEAYMKFLIEDNVFGKAEEIEKLLAKIQSDQDAIDLALRFEKESILFFNELLRLVSDTDKEPVRELIRQEQEHILDLAKLRSALNVKE
ncbi:ferritin family protein [Heliorestis acidaminivorans]|uniref:Ferritin family protein n=1 Tax=Heliorestis acidaminivorans TaxID=553427 RepID=A0A6I0ERY7_9FIRM|nr:ferritin family protein [Heliorestis acidaminivorans]KAB2952525.1 ferritin family protein [Heliorestis acidaminivorans]